MQASPSCNEDQIFLLTHAYSKSINGDLPHFILVQGTVHLQMPRLGPVCRRLGVDYAAAMTGFEIRGGRSVPTIDGVVICKEHEATVLEGYLEDEQ